MARWLLQALARAAHHSATLRPTIERTMAESVRGGGWDLGHVYVSTREPIPEFVSTLWHPGGEAFSSFRAATEAEGFEHGEGVIGSVAESGSPRWIEDIETARDFHRRSAALDAGLRSAFVVPIRGGPTVTAVIEFFGTEPREPDPARVRS